MLKQKTFDRIKDRRIVALQNGNLLARAFPIIANNITRANPLRELDAISNCCDYWVWDKFDKVKLLKLRKVNRCKSRLCPNCLSVNSMRFFKRYEQILTDNLEHAYHVTLTVPNVDNDGLAMAIAKLNNTFRDFVKKYSVGMHERYAKERIHDVAGIVGALRSDEVSYNNRLRNWHPHLHCLIITDKPFSADDLARSIDTGLYDFVRGERLFISPVENSLGQTWAKMFADCELGYMVRVEKIYDTKGLFEVVKYPAKFGGFNTLNAIDFATYYQAIYGKRIRQAYGSLYGVRDVTADDDGLSSSEVIALLDEEPETITTSLDDIGDYQDYKKYAKITVEDIETITKGVDIKREANTVKVSITVEVPVP